MTNSSNDTYKIVTRWANIDNSGMGNCMYYAYGISLMNYLIDFNSDDRAIDDIFDRLGVEEDSKEILKRILDAQRNTNALFLPEQLKQIEELLGPVLRTAAANAIYNEFVTRPTGTECWANASSQLFPLFKQHLKEREDREGLNERLYENIHVDEVRRDLFVEDKLFNLSFLFSTMIRYLINFISRHRFSAKDPDFSETDIFRVPGIMTAMSTFSRDFINHLDLNDSAVKNNVDSLYQAAVTEFFKQNEYQHLKIYRDYLAQDGVWGSTETLWALHNFLLNSRMENGVEVADRLIRLSIFNNGQNVNPMERGRFEFDIALNNIQNRHWVSQITETVSVLENPVTSTFKLKLLLEHKPILGLTLLGIGVAVTGLLLIPQLPVGILSVLGISLCTAGMWACTLFIGALTGFALGALIENSPFFKLHSTDVYSMPQPQKYEHS